MEGVQPRSFKNLPRQTMGIQTTAKSAAGEKEKQRSSEHKCPLGTPTAQNDQNEKRNVIRNLDETVTAMAGK